MREAVITSACRTPVGAFKASLAHLSSPRLGAITIREAVKRSELAEQPEIVDEVIMGCVLQAGLGQSPARQAAIFGDIPHTTPASTINKVCGSGLKAVMMAAQSIVVGDSDVVVAGGMESMTRAPLLLLEPRRDYAHGNRQLIDSLFHDGLLDPYKNILMGITGEIIAERYNVSREEADQFAAESQKRAVEASRSGLFKREIVPVEVPQRKKEPRIFDTDEGPREDATEDKLARLKPIFKEDGVVTAGNASSLNDGASALVVMSKEKADELGVKPIAQIIAYDTTATKPDWVMEAPITGVRNLLQKAGFEMDDIDIVEHNEAFATASVAVARELEISSSKFNIRGGAIALGHPLGASGARVLTTLLHIMQDENKNRGIETICLGGGEVVSMIVERM